MKVSKVNEIRISRNQKRQLERDLAKRPKEVHELVKVWKLENTINGDVPVYAFLTYGWTYPLYWSQQGKIKSGVSNDPFDDGTTRMNQACSKKTNVAEQPRVIPELKQVWIIPTELVGLDRSKANKIRNIFDERCNNALSKYKVKDSTAHNVGEEWYREISIEGIKDLRSNIWEELLIEYGTKLIEKKYKKIKARGLQIPAIKAIIKEFKDGVSRVKGIAPTGFGKTVVAFLTIAKLKAQGLLKNRIVMMTAPNQFLANKNASVFNEYAIGNKVKGIYNIPVFSGSDLGFNDDYITVLERKDKLASIICGYLQDDSDAIVILHTCNPSVGLVDDVLDIIGIKEIDFAICDEAHTLASTYDSVWNYVLEDHKVKINSRFFLTATEKTLVNPDFLEHVPNRGNRVAKFNYMNNKEIFGNYCFKFSFAQGVDAGHIVPMITKVFQYSDRTSSVADMLRFVDALDIPELESIKDELGRTVLFDKKFARTLVSIISIFKNEERNKLLTICSRNSHVKLLTQVIKALQDSGKYLQDIEVKDIMACDYSPSRRQTLLDNIHDSNKKWIIITGPWAITGVDCPSIDAVHWNFTPGTEISITQGTGRGARLHEGKQNVLVTFNLDLDNTLGVIRGTIANTVGKLYDAMFPSHDVELRNKMIRIYGGGFASIEGDDSDIIEPMIRISIDQIFEATRGIDFKDFLDSLSRNVSGREFEKYSLIIDDIFIEINNKKIFNLTKKIHKTFFYNYQNNSELKGGIIPMLQNKFENEGYEVMNVMGNDYKKEMLIAYLNNYNLSLKNINTFRTACENILDTFNKELSLTGGSKAAMTIYNDLEDWFNVPKNLNKIYFQLPATSLTQTKHSKDYYDSNHPELIDYKNKLNNIFKDNSIKIYDQIYLDCNLLKKDTRFNKSYYEKIYNDFIKSNNIIDINALTTKKTADLIKKLIAKKEINPVLNQKDAIPAIEAALYKYFSKKDISKLPTIKKVYLNCICSEGFQSKTQYSLQEYKKIVEDNYKDFMVDGFVNIDSLFEKVKHIDKNKQKLTKFIAAMNLKYTFKSRKSSSDCNVKHNSYTKIFETV